MASRPNPQGVKSEASSSSTSSRLRCIYGEWISFPQCHCGQELKLRTSWSNDNPGRRFWECAENEGMKNCGFFEWLDPPMCPRSKKIIPGLLKKINRNEDEIEKLNAKLRAASRGEGNQNLNSSQRTVRLWVLFAIVSIVLIWYILKD